jgi:hypothetical protein
MKNRTLFLTLTASASFLASAPGMASAEPNHWNHTESVQVAYDHTDTRDNRDNHRYWDREHRRWVYDEHRSWDQRHYHWVRQHDGNYVLVRINL